jgi:hypothetical protein
MRHKANGVLCNAEWEPGRGVVSSLYFATPFIALYFDQSKQQPKRQGQGTEEMKVYGRYQ